MNIQETERLLTVIQKSYPNYFKEFDPEVFEFQTKMWCRSLTNYTYEQVTTTFEMWMNTIETPPTLAGFKKLLAKNCNPKAFMSAEKAWEEVNQAIKKYGSYGQVKAFATFSEPIKRAINNVGGWHKICSTEYGQAWDFLRKNFMETFQEFGSSEKQNMILPPNTLNRLLDMAKDDEDEDENEQRKLN